MKVSCIPKSLRNALCPTVKTIASALFRLGRDEPIDIEHDEIDVYLANALIPHHPIIGHDPQL